MKYLYLSLLLFILSSCVVNTNPSNIDSYDSGTFGYDLNFLKQHQSVVVLTSEDSMSQVAVIPAYQGRVMTSTMKGLKGKSLGWINYNLISSKSYTPHIHAYGGEDRFWLGPEGGQYSIFFPAGANFIFEEWQTPGAIDTATYHMITQSSKKASFQKEVQLENYSGNSFEVAITRTVELLNKSQINNYLDISLSAQTDFVAFQSINKITNVGTETWKKDQGLLSIWILGMFPPSPQTTIIIPVKNAVNMSKYINDQYFGIVPNDRLILSDSVVYFKGDGNYRSKIGIAPEIAKPFMGSYNSQEQILTIVQFPVEEDGMYVNSLWEQQEEPYRGDVANSYNDGPLVDEGDQLGPFYELESSSSAKELKPNETITHPHRTYHFTGPIEDLDAISQKILRVSLAAIKQAFN